jgi:hypothetical protein
MSQHGGGYFIDWTLLPPVVKRKSGVNFSLPRQILAPVEFLVFCPDPAVSQSPSRLGIRAAIPQWDLDQLYRDRQLTIPLSTNGPLIAVSILVTLMGNTDPSRALPSR